jgi:type IV pilus assembly protein PilO
MSREQLIQTLWGENRAKVISVLIGILLIGAVQLWQGVWVEAELESTRQELKKAQADLDSIQQRIAEGGGLQISGLAEDLEHFYKMAPPRSGLGSFIGRLYSYAKAAKIDIDKISYAAKPVKETELLGYQLSFNVSGSYAQVKKFIHQLENSPSLLILDNISLAGKRQADDEVVNLKIQLQTFFQAAGQ